MATNFALLTKTYSCDLQDFTRLCTSIDLHMPNIAHYVVVDAADASKFAEFSTQRRQIIIAEDLLPSFKPASLFGRRFWLNAPLHCVRGWIFQQLAKLSAVASLSEDAVVLVDSDVVFLRPLRTSHVFEDGQVKLYHWPGVPSGPAGQSAKWHAAACRALGLASRGYTGADYISTVIAWSPAVVRSMLARIEASTQQPWTAALLRDFRFSECVMYGIFCELVAGPHQEKVVATREALCHWCWPYNLDHPAGADAFVEGLKREKVAALLQSNRRLPEASRAAIFARLQEQARLQDQLTAN